VNYTIRTVRATKITPDGKDPGAVFQVTQDEADILTHPDIDCVEYVDEAPPMRNPPRGQHHRRDQRAEE
jgi:hypothetical protein